MQVGIDEVGRGSLAGPLVVGAVCLKKPIKGLKDSKALSKSKREELAKKIYKESLAASLGWVWPHEIDEFGLTRATRLAIERALSLIDVVFDSLLIDGKYNFLAGNDLAETLIDADRLIPSVSAASIIAKVARDNYMRSIGEYFPVYDFQAHVGYGTTKHLEALLTNGPCVLHRLSFSPIRAEKQLYLI